MIGSAGLQNRSLPGGAVSGSSNNQLHSSEAKSTLSVRDQVDTTSIAGKMENINTKTLKNAVSSIPLQERLFIKDTKDLRDFYEPGSINWQCTTNENIRGISSTGPDGTVFAGGHSELYAIKDGKKLWDFALGDEHFAGVCAGKDNTAYVGYSVGATGIIAAVKDGKKLWDIEFGSFFTSNSHVQSISMGPDGTLYAASNNQKLYAIKDGKIKWKFRTTGTVLEAPCISKDSTVYVGTSEGYVYAIKNDKKLWKFQTGDRVYGSPCIGQDKTLYAATMSGDLFALKDGKALWKKNIGSTSFHCAPCIGPDNTVYITNSAGTLNAVKDGQKVWSYNFKSAGNPAIGKDGTVYIGAEGSLFAFKAGSLLWSKKLEGSHTTTPFIGEDGNIYIGDNGPQKAPDSYDCGRLGTAYAITPGEINLEKRAASSSGKIDNKSGQEGIIEEDEWIRIDGLKLPKK